MRALNIAATGMAAQNMRVEVISHNLANMSTTAYNARRAEFSDLHYQQIQRPGTINSADGAVLPAGVQLGLGVRAAAVSMQVAQGTVTETGGSLDLAIEGQGYLEITLPSGEPAYTRDGALKRDGDGLIVTSDGYTVVPDITIPEDARQISINADGEVYAYFDGQTEAQLLGQFNLVSFSNEKGLEALGSNLYRETEASGQPNVGEPGVDGRGTFRQGYLESSSVDAVHEITGLIEAQRGYELNAKVITAADQMLAAMTQIR
jgi:flagellar basal-body rod protein FlgG